MGKFTLDGMYVSFDGFYRSPAIDFLNGLKESTFTISFQDEFEDCTACPDDNEDCCSCACECNE